MQGKRLYTILLAAMICLPLFSLGQPRPWRRTVTIKDRQDGNKNPAVAKATFSAYYMVSRVSPGSPILAGPDGKPEIIKFNARPDGYIKFRIEKIEWVDPEFDKTQDFKVVIRNLWVNMSPKIYLDRKRANPGVPTSTLRRQFIAAPNVEYVHGDSLPPPIIYKIDQNNEYRFTIGMKAVTPNTTKEKPFVFTFPFTVNGLIRNGKGYGEPVVEELPPPVPIARDTAPVIVQKEPEDDGTAEIDAAVRRAIEEENAEALISLMKDHPNVQSVKDARPYLAIQMSRELIDEKTYRVDITYVKFTRTVPRRSQIGLDFAVYGKGLDRNRWPYLVWKGDKLLVSPPRDTIDYTLIATHLQAREHKAQTTLNSVNDFINLSYRDTLEDKISLRISGGKRPFMLHLERHSGVDFFAVEGTLKIYGDTVLDKKRLARAFGISDEGDFRVFVEDSDQLKKTGVELTHIVPPPPIPPIVWYLSAGLAIAFLIGFLIWKREKRRKDEEMEKLLAARGGKDPRVKRKPKPGLLGFWKETAVSELVLSKTFIREVSTYLRERASDLQKETPMIEGVILGTVMKFDFENEQYKVRLDRFRAIPARPLDYFDDKSNMDKWAEIREVSADHRNLVRIGWLQVVQGRSMDLSELELGFQDEQFSELFQMLVKINIDGKERETGFFTRTISGKMNDASDRQKVDEPWQDWDKLEHAGYYETEDKPVRDVNEEMIVEEDRHLTQG